MSTLARERTDRFAVVVGQRRGAAENDTLLARVPSERARAELAELLAGRSWESLERICRQLEVNRRLVGERPLLCRLADWAGTRAIAISFSDHRPTFAAILLALGVDSPHLTLAYAQRAAVADYGQLAALATGSWPYGLADIMHERSLGVIEHHVARSGGRTLYAMLGARGALSELLREASEEPLELGMDGDAPGYEHLLAATVALGPYSCQALVARACSELLGTSCDDADEARSALTGPIVSELLALPGSEHVRRDGQARQKIELRAARHKPASVN